jgi:homoserine kinase
MCARAQGCGCGCVGVLIRWGVEDQLHQPQRGEAVYKHLYPLIEAATAAGASGCYLSGAGTTVDAAPRHSASCLLLVLVCRH